MGLTLWATLNNVATIDGPIFTVLGADIVVAEMNQFSKSSVRLPAADRRAILAMQPYTLLEVVQDEVGTISYGYVLNPSQQITENDDDTLTLELTPLTVECMWRRTRRGWTADAMLSVVAARLGSLVPGWTGVFVDAATSDIQTAVNLTNPTMLAGFLDTAKQFSRFARQGVDATGAPARILEMGQFGAAPTVTLVSADGGDADAMAHNDLIRLVATVDRQPNNVEDLATVCVPFGGGNNDTLVTLERLWRIVNDPTYVNYGRWGTDAESQARTGQVSVFPEYDPVNYPISDPLNPPTGNTQWTFQDTAGNVVTGVYSVLVGARQSDGSTPLTVYGVSGPVTNVIPILSQGAYGTRAFTLDGHSDYVVWDTAGYQRYGHKEAEFIDSTVIYADNSAGNQEQTARALYILTTSNFKRFAHAHETFHCTYEGRGRPTRGGDLIAVDYQRVSVDESGAVVEMNVTENLRVMQTIRHFNGDAPPIDDSILSNLGRFDETDASGQADTARQMVALQLNQGTSLAPFEVSDRGNVDALHPLVKHVSVPKQLFRWQRCNLRVDFLPYTATSTTGLSTATPVHVTTPHGTHNLNGTFDSSHDNIGDVPPHNHQIAVRNSAASTPSLSASGSGAGLSLFDKTAVGSITTDNNITNKQLNPTAHGHNTPISNHPIDMQYPTDLTGTADPHTHPLDQRIPDGPHPVSCTVDINGQRLSSGLVLLSGTRNLSGAFTSSFEVDDISEMLNNVTGDLTITLTPGTDVTVNPYGVGMFVLSGTWVGEWGGLTSTVRAA